MHEHTYNFLLTHWRNWSREIDVSPCASRSYILSEYRETVKNLNSCNAYVCHKKLQERWLLRNDEFAPRYDGL